MTVVVAEHAHIKIWSRDGSLAFERCEDAGCTVAPEGVARCGRPACPECGCGGVNLAVADGFARCSCGHWWLRDH